EPGDGAGVRRVVSPHPAHHAAGDRPHPAGRVRLRGLRAAAERDLHLRPASPGGLTRSEDVGLAVAVGDDRQAGLEPLVHAAADVDRLEAVGVEPLADLEAAAAGAADDVHRVVGLGELVEVLHQRARREVLGVLGVAGVPFVLLAHVDEVRALGDGGRSDGLEIHGASLTAVPVAGESRRAQAVGRPAREGAGRPPTVRAVAQAPRTARRRTSGEATSTAAITSAYAAITLTRYCTATSGSFGAPSTAEITISAVRVARRELSTTGTAISAIRARCSWPTSAPAMCWARSTGAWSITRAVWETPVLTAASTAAIPRVSTPPVDMAVAIIASSGPVLRVISETMVRNPAITRAKVIPETA